MSKRTWLILVIVIIAVATIVGITTSRSPSSPSDFTLPIITWDETTLSTLEGTPVVLNFWSISCYWCRQLLPYLENVAQQNEGEIKVIAINIDDSASRVQDFFGDYEPAMTIALDATKEAFVDYSRKYNNPRWSIPFTLFVDSEGIVKYAHVGAFRSETELWDTLDSII
jgi:thiol-disulfide isomerase/thioredoxin